VLAVPSPASGRAVLFVCGTRVDAARLREFLIVGKAFDLCAAQWSRNLEYQSQSSRLRRTLELARTFSREQEVFPLLERSAKQAAELMHCDRASIFLWDKSEKQLVACPALGIEGGRLWLPDNKGIVGEVVHSGKPVVVEDAYADPRFDRSVDKHSGYRTRNLLCVPLIDPAGQCVGAFELINKEQGRFTDADVEALTDLGVVVSAAVENAQERTQLIRSHQQLRQQMADKVELIGESAAMEALRGTISRLAPTDLPILLLGESGTGKEVVAQALHFRGPRADNPFVAVNCAALTETLLESELFGHEKGAFTDAHATHAGKFEMAHGGTLFLDEIGDMSLAGQAKLLRVLEHKVITRVGGSQDIPVNVRVIAATNANLMEAVSNRRFRQDLFFRLSVVTIELPPLRDRPEDVLPLARHFLSQFCRQAGRSAMTLSSEAQQALRAHNWPGNIRELRNLMERVAFLSVKDVVPVEELAFILNPNRDPFGNIDPTMGLADATNRFQQEHIKRSIERARGNMSEAARSLGLHRSNLYRKMRQLGMDVDESKP
jgi:Nif-specific regulatory protein